MDEIKTSQTVQCRLEFINKGSSDLLIVPIPRDEIVNPTEIHGVGRERHSLKERVAPHEYSLNPYRNKFHLVGLKPNIGVKVDFAAPFLPSSPPVDAEFLTQCVENDERYTKWDRKDLIHNIVLSEIQGQDPSKVSDKDIIRIFGLFIKRKLSYSRNRDLYHFIDDLLFSKQTPKEDCLGYHAILVGCARSWGIPAVLDFGFRISGQDNPHTWAWYFDRKDKKWTWVDLNDSPTEVMIGPYKSGRVSMTLGTTHQIKDVPGIPNTTASFIQYGLGVNRIENRLPFTMAKFGYTSRDIE